MNELQLTLWIFALGMLGMNILGWSVHLYTVWKTYYKI